MLELDLQDRILFPVTAFTPCGRTQAAFLARFLPTSCMATRMLKTFLTICALAFACSALPALAQDPPCSPPPCPEKRPAIPDNWLHGLSPEQRLKAQAIMADHERQVRDLRHRIMQKKRELEHLCYAQDTQPETLPRLGRELQQLRDELRALFLRADQQMRAEVGVAPGRPASRGCSMDFPAPAAHE